MPFLLTQFSRLSDHQEAVLWKHKLQEWKDFNMDFGMFTHLSHWRLCCAVFSAFCTRYS